MLIGDALMFVFKDDLWFSKILRPAVFLIVPFVGVFLLAGWALGVCRGVVRGGAPALPAADVRRNLADGAAVMGIFAVCALPFCLAVALGGIGGAAWEAVRETEGGIDLYWWGVEFGGLIIALGGAVWAVVAVGRLADTGSVREALRIRGVVRAVRAAPAAYGLTLCSWLGLGLLALSGVAVCGVGLFFTTAFAAAAAFHLAGQAHRLAAEKAASGSVSGRL
ncbi:MAG: DUF4013 domain-containing protein [Anaerolineales bacterium]|nr:DUF4013 domain-containing protein [Anaerolineales bacterium]